MAPSATETITVTQPPLKLHSTKSGTGDYKQLQAHNVDRDAEEGRKEGIKAAKVREPGYSPPPLCLRKLVLAMNALRHAKTEGRPAAFHELH